MKTGNNGKFGSILVIVISAALLIYTASRSFNFLAATFPADKVLLAVAGLLALDGGVVGWLAVYLLGGMGTYQRAIALTLIVLDFLGSALTFIADTLNSSGHLGITLQMSQTDVQNIILAVSVLIAVNVAAGIAYHILDPKASRERALSDAQARVEDEALRLINDGIPQLAARMAPQMAQSILDDHENHLKISVSERRANTRKLASNSLFDEPNPAQLPASPRRVPAQPEPMDYEEEETRQAEQAEQAERVKVLRVPANPTPRPNGRHKE